MNKSAEQKKFIKQYIIDCIDPEAYDEKAETDEEKLKFLYKTFKSEKQWHIDQIGEGKAFEDWIRGLPTVFNIEWTNHDIIELAKKQGSLSANPTDKEENKILENYWNYITVNTFQLFKKYKIV